MHGMERANRLNRRPAWGWLYASAALALAPFVLVVKIVPEGAVRTLMEVIAALILIGALASWVRVNRIALELQGRRDCGWRQATMTAMAPERTDDLHLRGHATASQPPRTEGNLMRPARQKGPRDEGFAFVPRG
jgi:hypothetical protein